MEMSELSEISLYAITLILQQPRIIEGKINSRFQETHILPLTEQLISKCRSTYYLGMLHNGTQQLFFSDESTYIVVNAKPPITPITPLFTQNPTTSIFNVDDLIALLLRYTLKDPHYPTIMGRLTNHSPLTYIGQDLMGYQLETYPLYQTKFFSHVRGVIFNQMLTDPLPLTLTHKRFYASFQVEYLIDSCNKLNIPYPPTLIAALIDRNMFIILTTKLRTLTPHDLPHLTNSVRQADLHNYNTFMLCYLRHQAIQDNLQISDWIRTFYRIRKPSTLRIRITETLKSLPEYDYIPRSEITRLINKNWAALTALLTT